MRARVVCLLLLLPLALSITGCSAPITYLPTPTGMVSVEDLPTPAPNTTPQPRLLEQRLITLEWPETIREKDSDLITLAITIDEQGQLTATAVTDKNPGGTPIEIPNVYDTHDVTAIARLDMAGVEAYREEIREPLKPGQPVTFRWSIRANEAGIYQGIVWLRLELAPKIGGRVEERLLLARTIQVRAVTVFGLPGDLARILGGIGLVLSTALGYPFIQGWVAEWLKRRKNKGRPRSPRKPASKEVEEPKEKD